MTLRQGVVGNIVTAFLTDSPAVYPVDATGAERAAAEELIAARLATAGLLDDPRQRARRILYRAYQPGDDWDDLFDRLSPAEIQELRGLLPHLPGAAARYFALRFLASHCPKPPSEP